MAVLHLEPSCATRTRQGGAEGSDRAVTSPNARISENLGDLTTLLEFSEVKVVIDKTYLLSEAADAVAYMLGPTPDDADNDRQRRLENQYKRLGTRTPACSRYDCTETDPFAMTGVHPYIECYEHERIADGLNPIEADHRAGQHNDPMTLLIPGNDHRVLSDMQQDWPLHTLRNPYGSPLIRAAATLRGFLDLLWLLLMRILARIPAALESLDRILTDVHGDQWWVELGWELA